MRREICAFAIQGRRLIVEENIWRRKMEKEFRIVSFGFKLLFKFLLRFIPDNLSFCGDVLKSKKYENQRAN